jgi:microcystin-dependent protein
MSAPIKPTQKPTWGTGIAPGDIATPPAGQMVTGWIKILYGALLKPQKIPYQWMNWFMTLVSAWIDYFESMTDYLVGAQIVPPGAVLPYAGSVAPEGYFIADGSEVSRTVYLPLFNVIGITYGAGDTTTTYNLPDLRIRVPVGYKSTETEFNALGKTGGAKTHTLSVGELPSHAHAVPFTLDGHDAAGTGSDPNVRPVNPTGSATTSSVGSGDAHNNLQPYITLNYIIKF